MLEITFLVNKKNDSPKSTFYHKPTSIFLLERMGLWPNDWIVDFRLNTRFFIRIKYIRTLGFESQNIKKMKNMT